jgi:hypothetical protein
MARLHTGKLVRLLVLSASAFSSTIECSCICRCSCVETAAGGARGTCWEWERLLLWFLQQRLLKQRMHLMVAQHGDALVVTLLQERAV